MSIHYFPVWLSRFIGREKEMAEVQNQMNRTRLLTLSGPGGSGKTRLALEAAGMLYSQFKDGAWFIDLASLQDGSLAPQTILFSLGLTEIPGQPAIAYLIDYLKSRNLLLVFDNCEHLVEESAKLAHTLLAACPELRILATSREPLQISGEVVVQILPLTLPDRTKKLTLDDALQCEAVQLFTDRAQLVVPGFEVNNQNIAAVAEICRQVDGIPLALEIAAARVNALPLSEIASRIGEAGQAWRASNRLAPTRQQTIQSTLDWSYALLEAEEQRLFWRLAVFTAGFHLEAVRAVCGGDGIEPESLPWLLSRLVDKSLVVYTPGRDPGSAGRYRMLEVIHQYGLERLKKSGEEGLFRGRHFDWCLALVHQADFSGIQRGYWLTHIDEELPNLRQAFTWGKEQPDRHEQVYRMARLLSQFFQSRGYFQEGLAWVQSLLAIPSTISKELQADTYSLAAFITTHMDDFAQAEKYNLEAIRLYRETGNRTAVAWHMTSLGTCALAQGNYELAKKYNEETLAILENLDTGFEMAIALMSAGDLAFIAGDYPRASALMERSIEISRSVGNWMGVSRRQVRLAQYRIALGDLERAYTLLEECQKDNQGNGDRWITAMIVLGVASIAAAQRRWSQTALCLGITQHYQEVFGTRLWAVDRSIFQDKCRQASEQLGTDAFSAALEEGRRIGSDTEQVESFLTQLLNDWLVSPVPVSSQGSKRTLTAKQAAKQAFDGLTTREREVAALIAQGKNNTEIAANLYLTVRTVETHVTKILTKLGYSSRTQVAVWAAGKGLGVHETNAR